MQANTHVCAVLDPDTAGSQPPKEMNTTNENHHLFMVGNRRRGLRRASWARRTRMIGDYCDVQDSLYGETDEETVRRNCLIQENPHAADGL